MDQAIEFYKKLLENHKPIQISLNITPITLLRTDFVQKILEKKEILGFDSKYLTFEITETSLIENFQKVEEIVDKLKEHNFSFALDDFGKGYSSLSYLESLPVDIIKIDRSLIQDIHLRERKRILVEAIALLSKKLKLISFAEGVEKKEEFEWIQAFDISYVQGFLFAKPMPESEFLKILRESTP